MEEVGDVKQHPKALAEAGISPARYAELRAICRQYGEMRQTARAYRRMGMDALVERRVKLIDQCAEAVGGKIVGMAIVRNVTEGESYAYLRPPCGEWQFYKLRTEFFVELNRRRWEVEME